MIIPSGLQDNELVQDGSDENEQKYDYDKERADRLQKQLDEQKRRRKLEREKEWKEREKEQQQREDEQQERERERRDWQAKAEDAMWENRRIRKMMNEREIYGNDSQSINTNQYDDGNRANETPVRRALPYSQPVRSLQTPNTTITNNTAPTQQAQRTRTPLPIIKENKQQRQEQTRQEEETEERVADPTETESRPRETRTRVSEETDSEEEDSDISDGEMERQGYPLSQIRHIKIDRFDGESGTIGVEEWLEEFGEMCDHNRTRRRKEILVNLSGGARDLIRMTRLNEKRSWGQVKKMLLRHDGDNRTDEEKLLELGSQEKKEDEDVNQYVHRLMKVVEDYNEKQMTES